MTRLQRVASVVQLSVTSAARAAYSTLPESLITAHASLPECSPCCWGFIRIILHWNGFLIIQQQTLPMPQKKIPSQRIALVVPGNERERERERDLGHLNVLLRHNL